MTLDIFSESYEAARERFFAAARAAGSAPRAIVHRLKGPQREELAIDVVRLGAPDAPCVLWVSSGTHGIEGFCGSAVQRAALRAGTFTDLPVGVAVLLVHAVNPWGFAWQRRVNEDNVDLNRNFIDHGAPLPENAIYDELHDALCPKQWDEATLAASEAVLEAARKRHGAREVLEAVSRGQYRHSDGLFYGGRTATWSNRAIAVLARQELAAARHVAIVDLHTGLGPSGHGELIATASDAGSLATLRDWYGDEVKVQGSGSVAGTVTGALRDGIAREIDAEVPGFALEFGTVAREEVRLALRADNWLHCHGDAASEEGRAIKRQIRVAFYPESEDWRRAVLERSHEVLGKALAGLARMAEGCASKRAS